MEPVALPEPAGDTLPLLGWLPPGWLWPLLLALAALAGLVRWWSRRQPAAAPLRRPPPAAPPGAAHDWLEDLATRTRRSRDYRAGCHELGVPVQAWLEHQLRLETDALTIREIAALCGDRHADVVRLAIRLRDLGYGAEAPDERQFSEAVKDVRRLVIPGKRR